MTDLTPEARALVDATRNAEAPTPADRARIKRTVLMQVAVLGAAGSATGSAVAMSLATKITLVSLTAVAIGGGAVSAWKWRDQPTPPRAPTHGIAAPAKPVPIAPPPVASAPVEVPPALPMETPRIEPPKKSVRRPPTVEPTLPVAPSPTTPSARPLEAELAVLRQAQHDLRAGLPAQALRRLNEFERDHGPGSLGQERQAIQAIALCQARPGPAAQAQADAFLRTASASPLAARVRSACEKNQAPEKQSNENQPPREP